MKRGFLGMVLSALAFSISYGFLEYYVIRDTTFGYNPVLFSLLYPYHFAMASVFGLAAYSLLRTHIAGKDVIPSLVLVGAIFFSMLAVEDFTWFTLRAVAPVQGDMNAGRLVLPGEWTTQFMGSVDAYFTAIPNWYFLSVAFLAAFVATREKQDIAVVAKA